MNGDMNLFKSTQTREYASHFRKERKEKLYVKYAIGYVIIGENLYKRSHDG